MKKNGTFQQVHFLYDICQASLQLKSKTIKKKLVTFLHISTLWKFFFAEIPIFIYPIWLTNENLKSEVIHG